MLDKSNYINFTTITNFQKMKLSIIRLIATTIFVLTVQFSMAQTASISGKIISEGKPVEFANVGLVGTSIGSLSDTSGVYKIKNVKGATMLLGCHVLDLLKWIKLFQ